MSIKIVQLAVREFAQPNMRHGHIDMFSGYRTELSVGSEIHRLLQEAGLKDIQGYQKEVSLSGSFTFDGWSFSIGGRIDALIDDGRRVIIEEIKSTGSIDRLRSALERYDDHPYKLQVRTYAYLYWLMKNVMPECRLRIVSSMTQKDELIDVSFDPVEFEAWRDQRSAFLLIERKRIHARIKRRVDCSKEMVFPFDRLRPSQEALLETVKAAVAAKKHLLVQAPTGLGKTAGVSFPSLREAMSRGKQLVYVTPKNSQHKLAEEVVQRLRQQGLPINSLLMTAKSKVCMQEEPVCTPEHCEYARNYYDKLSEHDVVKKLSAHEALNAEVFKSYAQQYKVCPFELSLEMLDHADVVIGDYNYVFSPRAALLRLQVNESEENLDNNLVIDEAHNLPQRLCDYLSPELSEAYLLKLKDRIDELPDEFHVRWKKLLNSAIKILKHHEPSHASVGSRALITVEWDDFFELERRINAFLIAYFESVEKIEAKDPAITLQRYWADFTYVALHEDMPFFATYRHEADDASIKITCCDASNIAKDAMNRFASAVGFSATYKPFDYFSHLSGFDSSRVETAEFTSPFPPEHRKVMVIPQVSTRFRDRERSYARVAETVRRVVSLKKGNYFVFFPSYDFLAKTAPLLQVEGFRLLKQEPYMNQKDAEAIVATLSEQSRGVLVLAVQGGVFAEGVDYPGDVLIGAFIVGPGLPVFDFEREQLRKYYEERFGSGFEFAYIYPGMTRVIQAAGRVIRTEEDRGLIVLIDDRFLEPLYAASLPQDWYRTHIRELASQSILADVQRFWGEKS